MPRIDFYIMPGTGPDDRERLCCRLAEKAYKLGHRVYLHTDSAAQAERLDETLWTFRAGSFVPHARATANPGPLPPPVVIGGGDEPPPVADLLINLTDTVPAFYERFARIAEIIDQTEENRRLGRERFRFYRDRGLEPHSHNL